MLRGRVIYFRITPDDERIKNKVETLRKALEEQEERGSETEDDETSEVDKEVMYKIHYDPTIRIGNDVNDSNEKSQDKY